MPVAIRAITRIQDADDAPTLGAGQDGFVLTWDNASGAFVAEAMPSAVTPGGSNTQVQFNDAGAFGGDAGMTYDAANDALTVAGRIITPVIRPASDSTTAVRIQNAAGTTSPLVIDTTNGRVGINGTPSSARLYVLDNNNAGGLRIDGTANPGVSVAVGGTLKGFMPAVVTSGNAYLIGSSPDDLVIRADTAGARILFGITGIGTPALTVSTNGIAVGQVVSATAFVDIAAGTTALAQIRLRNGVAPTSPNNGDIWFDGTDIKMRIGGVTKTFTLT